MQTLHTEREGTAPERQAIVRCTEIKESDDNYVVTLDGLIQMKLRLRPNALIYHTTSDGMAKVEIIPCFLPACWAFLSTVPKSILGCRCNSSSSEFDCGNIQT